MRRKTTEEFIADAVITHGDRYDYSKVVYEDSRTKVTIICKVHGEFLQAPHKHTYGRGCPKCAGVAASIKYSAISRTTIVDRFQKVHGDKYDYSAMVYVNRRTKIEIICNTHKDSFWQSPDEHLRGRGCLKCARGAMITAAKDTAKTTEKFIVDALAVHGDKYDYSLVVYTNKRTKIEVICPVDGHGPFLQNPSNHLIGHGCPLCQKNGFQKAKPGLLYYLKLKDHNLWKIGITNRSVELRFTVEDLTKVEILWVRLYESGQECYETEQRILQEFKHLRYVGPDILTSGNTELFTEDVVPTVETLAC
jgi:hypothetical protein